MKNRIFRLRRCQNGKTCSAIVAHAIVTNINPRTVAYDMVPDEDLFPLLSEIGETTPEEGIILGKTLGTYRNVIVGTDSSRAGTVLKESLISGLLFAGADVTDAEEISIPALALQSSKFNCAVYVTGAEKKETGFFLMNPDGSPFSMEQIRHLETLRQTAENRTGVPGKRRSLKGAVSTYNRKMNSDAEKGVKCSVVAYCNNGPCSSSLSDILNSMGADVLSLSSSEGFLPSAEKTAETLEVLVSADPGVIGVHLNDSGTVAKIFDETGTAIPPENVFALLALYLKPSSIAISADSPSIISDAFFGKIGTEIETPHDAPEDRKLVFVENDMSSLCAAVAKGAKLGYIDGKIVFGDGPLSPDGIRVTSCIVRMAGDNSLHKICETFPTYFRSVKEYETDIHADAFKHLAEAHLGDYTEKCVRYGNEFRISLEEGWVLIRHVPSAGTVEVVAESGDKAYNVGLMEIADRIAEAITQIR